MRFVEPKVSLEEARGILGRRRRLSLRRKREMKKTELLNLPYYLYRVAVSQGNDEHEIVVCTDGIGGGFSFFDESGKVFSEQGGGEVFDFLVSQEEAERASLENLRWHLVRRGLRLKVKASVKEIREVERIHYPYWVAYFRGPDGYNFRAADAVTGEVQGIRMRKTFLTALAQPRAPEGPVSAARNSPQRARRTQR